MTWLLDTCVISELVKPRPKASVVAWIDGRAEDELFLSVITIGELEKGIAKLREPERQVRLATWVRRELADRFQDRVLPINRDIAARCGALAGASEARGESLSVIDSLIAATSLHHDLTVVTRNAEDLGRCGARCFNPWLEK